MRALLSIFFISLFFLSMTNAQRASREAGFFLGTSYYIGDINTNRQFYAPSLSFGGLFKFFFNDRHGLRIQANYGQFRANDKDFSNAFQLYRNSSFSATLLDLDAIYEFNFLPYKFNERKTVFSPYLFGGLGYEFVLQSQNPMGNHLAIPFGIGIKYLVSRKVSIGIEWSFRKTFRDNIDGIQDPGVTSENSLISNKDWYSFAGFFITFRLFDNTGDCPVYR